ncbi:MAG: hypothetical protein NTW48_08800 [Chloroflexi bacterium]|nr:hypothetical protein [Chloroflexota bacterium]
MYDEFGAKKMNDFVAYVKSLTPVAGKGIKISKNEAGVVFELNNEVLEISGDLDTHYAMGECFYASNRTAPSGGRTYGPWGGICDPGINQYPGSIGQQPSLPTGTTVASPSFDEWNRLYRTRLSSIINRADYPFGVPEQGVKFNFIEREFNVNEAWLSFDTSPCAPGSYQKFYSAVTDPAYAGVTVPKTFTDFVQGEHSGFVNRQARFDAFGRLEIVGTQALSARRPYFELPYLLGTTSFGSSTAGPGGVTGYWGGERDKSSVGYITSGVNGWTDTWNVTRQPIGPFYPDNVSLPTGPTVYMQPKTFGVEYYPLRPVLGGTSGNPQIVYYQRPLKFDCRGGLFEIGEEEAVPLGGGGGAGAIIPLNIYGSYASGGSMYVKVYNGTFGGNVPNAPGNEVPTITEGGVAVRIDAATAPKLSVPSGTKLVYIKVNVNTGGYVLNSLYETTSSVDTPANTTGTLYLKIATVSATTGSVTITEPQNVRGSQTYELCGGSVHLYALP